MQIVEFKRTGNKFIPVDDDTVEVAKKVQDGESIYFEYKPKKAQRNYKNHKRFFSMLKGVIDNSDYYKTTDNLLDVIKLKTGYFEIVVSHEGKQLYIPKSIAFDKMPEDEFKEFFSNAIDVVLEFTPEEDINSILSYC